MSDMQESYERAFAAKQAANRFPTHPLETPPMTDALAAATPSATSVSDRLLELAIDKNIGVEGLERLVALHERMADRAAAREFVDAMAAFQAECPPVAKTSTAHVTTKSGGGYSYRYAELDEIALTVRPHLHKHGLSYRWDCLLSENGAHITVTCTLSHVNGHKETASFSAPTASLSGAMSKQQEVAASLTFGKRQTLIQVLGLTTTDPDTDASGVPLGPITPEQVEVLEALVDQRPPGSREKLLAWIGVSTMEEIPASRFEVLKKDLEAKIRAQK